jgi:hypothetical protein
MREGVGGAIACCGSFLPGFVSLLPDKDTLISDVESKGLMKILKAVAGGARKLLRIAAELQLGLNGVNWRQTTIVQYYKPTVTPKTTRVRKNWADLSSPSSSSSSALTLDTNDKSKNKNIKNKHITMNNIFDCTNQIGNIVYWEIKAG